MKRKRVTRPLLIYTFYNERIRLSVTAHDLADAIEWLKVIFGESWVKYNIDNFEFIRFKTDNES